MTVVKLLRYILYFIVGYLLYKIIGQSYKDYKISKSKKDYKRASAAHGKMIKGEMVKDPVCNTYIPRDISIKDTFTGKTYYFCSQECREKFIKKLKAKE